MRTPLSAASGFTLLELLFSMLIAASLLALGAAFYQPHISALEKSVPQIGAMLSRARVDAMLSRNRTVLEFTGDRINQLDQEGGRSLLARLPAHTGISLNGKSLMQNSSLLLSFGPLGYAGENIIHLRGQEEAWSIYLPPLAGPVARKGILSLEEMRKEKP